MADTGSILTWIGRLQDGDRAAVEKLWERFFTQLVTLAKKKLQAVPRQMADEEDVALSAIKSFCRAAEERRFPKLETSGDLWQILVLITRHKVADLWDYHTSAKRDFRRVQPRAHLPMDNASEADAAFVNLVEGGEPDPRFAAEAAEQMQYLLKILPDEQMRQIALAKMEGYTNEEIAAQLGCAPPTVERRLRRIRNCWLDAGCRPGDAAPDKA